MWDTYLNPALKGSTAKATRIIRGGHLLHNTFVLSLCCWDIKSIIQTGVFKSKILLPWRVHTHTHKQAVMSNHYVTMQSAWFPWGPPWQQANFQTSVHPHGTNGKRLPSRRQTCSIEHTLCNTSSDSLHVSRAAQVDQHSSNLTEESVSGIVCTPHICVGLLQVIWNMHVWHVRSVIRWSTADSCELFHLR